MAGNLKFVDPERRARGQSGNDRPGDDAADQARHAKSVDNETDEEVHRNDPTKMPAAKQAAPTVKYGFIAARFSA